MNKLYTKLLSFLSFTVLLSTTSFGQNCVVDPSATQYQIYCGQSVTLSVFSQGADSVLLAEDFNDSTVGAGWDYTPGGIMWGNPCSPGGVDGTTHAWMGPATNQPRDITSSAYDLSTATAGVTICFDMMYATQGTPPPCEGPDDPDEGVHLQYSTDGGITWIDMQYWDPNGGNDPQLTNWNNYCVTIPAAALTSSTQFRWHQDQTSSNLNDHWGLDNPSIVIDDQDLETVWGQPGDGYYHAYPIGSHGGDNPNIVSPTTTTTYYVTVTNGDGDVCTDSVTIVVLDPVYNVLFDEDPISLCPGDTCADISGVALQMFYPVYEEKDTFNISVTPSAIPNVIPGTINGTATNEVTSLDITSIENGSIQSICIDSLSLPTSGNCSSLDFSNTQLFLECPDGTQINLANTGDLSGTAIYDICFEMGADPLSSGSSPYNGTFAPADPFNGLNGCNANGTWKLVLTGSHNSSCNLSGAIHDWEITFSYSDTVYNHTWNADPTLSDLNDINTTACPTQTTDYVITVSNGLSGCPSGTDTLSIFVSTESPSIDALNVTDPLCHDDCNGSIIADVSGSTAPYTYQWYDALGNPVGTNSDTLDNLCAGDYTLEVFDIGGCGTTGDTTLINPDVRDPAFEFNSFCENSENQADSIQSEGGVFSFNPDPGDGATIDSITGEITGGVGGTVYTVQYTTENSCSSSTQNVVVFHTPVVDFVANPTEGQPILVVDYENLSSGADEYTWDFGDGFSEQNNDLELTHDFDEVGTYTTILTGETVEGCSDSASVEIIVVFPDMIYEFPNVFTPNGDNENDLYKLINPQNVAELNIIIVNRWGNLVFESNEINFNWNGKVKNSGADCDDGTYFYKATLKGLNDKEKQEHGFIHLNRN